MKNRPRIYYTESQRTLMGERWRQGEFLQHIAQLFDRNHSSIERILAETGGISPAQRCRSRLALTFSGRDSTVSPMCCVDRLNPQPIAVVHGKKMCRAQWTNISKKILFDATKESPGSWYWVAITLKAAADRLPSFTPQNSPGSLACKC
jgi:hypothetical protein